MRAKIKQVIDGKTYDTETAEIVASNEYWDGHNFERRGTNMHLYKTKKGAFFVGHSTQWEGERDSIQVLSVEEAKQEYEHLPEHEMEYEEAFGVKPETA